MLKELPVDIRKDVKILGKIMKNNYKYSRVEDRDLAVDLLVNHISDYVITVLLREDKERQDYFLSNK